MSDPMFFGKPKSYWVQPPRYKLKQRSIGNSMTICEQLSQWYSDISYGYIRKDGLK